MIRRSLREATFPTSVVVALSGVEIVCWLTLYPFYSLADHYSVQYFAFEKIAGHFESPVLRLTAALFLVISVCYGLIYWLLQLVPGPNAIIKISIVAGIGVAVAVNTWLYPVGALDVYNYIVEIKLALFYRENPYLSTFMAYSTDPAGQFAFFNHVPLLYGPLWLFLSGLPTLVTGFDDTQHVLVGLKLENSLLLAVTAAALYAYQRNGRRGWVAVQLFAANPLVIFESLGNAHNDLMMTAFLVLALLALHHRSWVATPLLMLSALVKFFSAALFPLFVLDMCLKGWSKRTIAASLLVSLALAIALVWPFWAQGQMLTGLSKGISTAQSLNSESLFSLAREYLRLGSITPQTESAVQFAFLALFCASVAVLTVAVWRGLPLESALIDTLLLFAILVSLLTPWYLLPALALIALRGDQARVAYLLVATALGLLYYPFYVWAWFDSGLSSFEVHLFLALFLTLPILMLLVVKLASAGTRNP